MSILRKIKLPNSWLQRRLIEARLNISKFVRLTTYFGFISSASLLLTACSSMSAGNLFSHYSEQRSSVYHSLKAGNYQQAQKALGNEIAGPILDNLENGRIALLNQNYPQSRSYFDLSDQAIKEQQQQAVISVTQGASNLAALATNDNVIAYQASDYELGFMHLYLGINYIQTSSNGLEEALVEMRRANQVQEQALKSRKKELEKAQAEMKSQGVTTNVASVLSRYPNAGQQLQAVQNAYLSYLSGLLYEAANDLNNAYIDYKRALAVMPKNRAVIDRTLRLAKKLAMKEDLAKLTKQYGKPPKPLAKGKGRVIIIEERGLVNMMNSWQLSLPFYDSRGQMNVYSLALPYYSPSTVEHFSALRIGQQTLKSDKLTDVNLMAQQSLTERIPEMVIRQGLRVVAKNQIRKEVAKDNDVGNLLFNVLNTLTEQPDTRSWQSLPAEVYSSSIELNVGEQQLQAGKINYLFEVKEGKTILLWVSRQADNATIWHKYLPITR